VGRCAAAAAVRTHPSRTSAWGFRLLTTRSPRGTSSRSYSAYPVNSTPTVGFIRYSRRSSAYTAFDDGTSANASSEVVARAFPWPTDRFERAQAGIEFSGCER
jgi:hypothetical protein